MTNLIIFILLGGLVGVDGYAVSPGILLLAHRLDALGDVTIRPWSAQYDVTQRIAALKPNDKVVLITRRNSIRFFIDCVKQCKAPELTNFR